MACNPKHLGTLLGDTRFSRVAGLPRRVARERFGSGHDGKPGQVVRSSHCDAKPCNKLHQSASSILVWGAISVQYEGKSPADGLFGVVRHERRTIVGKVEP